MDLTIPLEKFILNIRVAVLVKTGDGFVLEKSKLGYYFPTGGRIKVGETSEEAARREVFEELGVVATGLKLRAIIEQFYGPIDKRFQEICFVYSVDPVGELKLTEGFGVYTLSQIESLDFRPEIIKEILKSSGDGILHLSMKN